MYSFLVVISGDSMKISSRFCFIVIQLILAGYWIQSINGLCVPGWSSAGDYCYFIYMSSTGIPYKDAISYCGKRYGTLAIFPLKQDATDFYSLWLNSAASSGRSYLGYAHNIGVPGVQDIISIYDGSTSYYTNFFTKEPNMAGGVEWCVEVYEKLYDGFWNDITCGVDSAVICQQSHTFDSTVTSVKCAPVCQASGTTGHRFSTLLKNCQKGMQVENATIGYASTMHMDGLTEVIYEVTSTGNTLMVYGAHGLAKLDPAIYSIANLFFVPTLKLVNTMIKFALMNGTTNNQPDSLIVQYDSAIYATLNASNWTESGVFYLFTRYPGNYICPFAIDCEWDAWQSWSSCTVSCAGGTRKRSRVKIVVESNYGICNNVYSQTESCNTQHCPIDCEWSEWDQWPPCPVTCGGIEQNRTRWKLVEEQFGGYCNNNDTDVQYCNTNPCPIDCVISNWTLTAPCSVTCGTGFEIWNRTILTNVMYGGKACPNETMQEHRQCEIQKPCYDWVVPVIQAFQCFFITFSLLSCFVLYLSLRIFSLERYLHMCQEISLVMAHFLMWIFAWRAQADKFDPFFYTALFMFLLLESLQSYCITTNVVSDKGFIPTKYFMAIGWGVPAIITSVMSIRLHTTYVSKYSCWLNWGHSSISLWTAFLIIAFGYCCIIFLEAGTKQISRPLPLLDADKWTAAVVSMYSMLFVIPLNLASWFTATRAIYEQNIYMHGTVVGINMALAIVTFKFHIAANEQVEDYVRKKFSCCRCFIKRKD